MPSPDDCELGITEDISHQRLEWRIEKVAWTIIALVLLAGLLGVFGSGPLSRRTLDIVASGMEVEYERYTRRNAPAELTLTIAPRSDAAPLRLSLGLEFLASNELTSMEPAPQQVEAWPTHNVYVFNAPAGEGPVRIRFHFEPDAIGGLTARLQLEGHEPLEISQFVYP